MELCSWHGGCYSGKANGGGAAFERARSAPGTPPEAASNLRTSQPSECPTKSSTNARWRCCGCWIPRRRQGVRGSPPPVRCPTPAGRCSRCCLRSSTTAGRTAPARRSSRSPPCPAGRPGGSASPPPPPPSRTCSARSGAVPPRPASRFSSATCATPPTAAGTNRSATRSSTPSPASTARSSSPATSTSRTRTSCSRRSGRRGTIPRVRRTDTCFASYWPRSWRAAEESRPPSARCFPSSTARSRCAG